MNERIQELAKQAGVIALSENGIAPPLEEFAELILLEVRLLIADARIEYHSDEADDALVSVLISIEKHFGVEE